MDPVKDAPPVSEGAPVEDDLSSMSLEELGQKEQDLVAQFDAADEADDLDTMSTVADELDRVRAAMEELGEPADKAAAETPLDEKEEFPMTAAADAPVATDTNPEAIEGEQPVVDSPASEEQADAPADPETPETPADPEAGGDEAEAEADAKVESETPPGATDDPTPEAVAASGETTKEDTVGDIPEKRQPVTVTASANTIVAGTDIQGFPAGQPFANRMDVAIAMDKRLESISRSRGGPEQNLMVASIIASAPPERTLDPNEVEANLRKIDDIIRKEAIVASGGYCAPLETRYDIFGTGTTDRPVRDALAGFQAKRGGIRYTAAPKIGDFAGASGIWTAANDAAPATTGVPPDDVVTPKNCMIVECQPEVTAVVDAVTLCLQFGNLMTRAYPELIDRNNQLALVAHARYAERALLNKLTALSISVTSGFKWGVARDFMLAVGKAATAYRHRYRMEPTQPLRVLAPIWVRDAVREDLAMQMPGDNTLSVADNIIDGFLRDRNVNVSWHLDAPGFNDEVEASVLDDFPATFDWYIYAEGAFIFLDGGTLDLGIVRDSELVGTNDYKTFTESFEGVARIGAESIRVTTTTHVIGGSTGSVAVA